MAPSESSALYGRPTTASAGCHSLISASTAPHCGPSGPALSPGNGEAARLRLSPQATPMRRRPKSKASTSCGLVRPGLASGISTDRADARDLDAEQPCSGLPAGLERQIEDDAGFHGRIEPGVGANLVLELPSI